MSKNHKKFCTTLNYIEHFLIFATTIFYFASLLGIPIGITSSVTELKICAVTVWIKKY